MSALACKTSNKMYDWRVRSIYQALKEAGKETGKLDVSDLIKLGHLDQYHYLGVEACDQGIDILGLTKNSHVFDIGSGVGGPARYLADKTGCNVTGIELQASLNEMAIELTKRVELDHKVNFITGDILDVDSQQYIKENSFDHFISWLVFLHIPQRTPLFSTCFKSLKPNGTFLIEDMVALQPLSTQEKTVLKEVVFAPYIPDVERYAMDLTQAGFTDIKFDDISLSWREWANSRYQLHHENKLKNTQLYGDTIFASRNVFYKEVATLFNGGHLGGMRITGRKPS